jgi:hypothetical protein
VGIWHGGVLSRSLSGYVTTFGEACVPTLGLEGGVWFNPRVTFDGKVRNLGPCVLNFDSSLPEEHRANILSFLFLSTDNSLRYQCKLGGGSTSISCTSVTVYRGSKRGRRVVTGTAKTSKVGLSYHRRQGSSPHSRHAGVLRPGLNRRRPGSLYHDSIIIIRLSPPPPPQAPGPPAGGYPRIHHDCASVCFLLCQCYGEKKKAVAARAHVHVRVRCRTRCFASQPTSWRGTEGSTTAGWLCTGKSTT